MKNKYIFRSKISEKKFREILRLFSLDIEGKKAAEITGTNRQTINKIFGQIRERIAQYCQENSLLGTSEIELDESYFGAKRVRGKRGRGAKGKTPVFGMLKRDGRVYTQIIKDCSMSEIMPIIEQQADKNAIIYADGFKTYEMGLLILAIRNIIE